MKSAFPPLEKAKVTRPAIIAIRFTGTDMPDSAFQKAAKLYQTILGTKPEAGKTENYQYYSFQVGLDTEPKKGH